MRLPNDTLNPFRIRGRGVSEEEQLLHRPHVLQQRFVWVLCTPLQLPSHPPFVVSGEKFLAKQGPELIESQRVLSAKAEPSRSLVSQCDRQDSSKNLLIDHSRGLLVMEQVLEKVVRAYGVSVTLVLGNWDSHRWSQCPGCLQY